MLGVVVCLVTGILAVQRGRFGRLLGALAESPTMLTTHGLGLSVTRLLVFCLSAFFAGVSGALVITQTGAASGVTFGPIQSLLFLSVLGVCGTSRLRSPVLAAALFGVLPGYVTGFGADRQMLVFGATALLAAVALARRGPMAAAVGRLAASTDERRLRTPVPPIRTRQRVADTSEDLSGPGAPGSGPGHHGHPVAERDRGDRTRVVTVGVVQ
jgi:hypothetical protein